MTSHVRRFGLVAGRRIAARSTSMKTSLRLSAAILAGASLLGSALALAATSKHRPSFTAPASRVSLEGPRIRVLPWNGHRAALTLTFDDASPSQADEALPVLDEKGVKG